MVPVNFGCLWIRGAVYGTTSATSAFLASVMPAQLSFHLGSQGETSFTYLDEVNAQWSKVKVKMSPPPPQALVNIGFTQSEAAASPHFCRHGVPLPLTADGCRQGKTNVLVGRVVKVMPLHYLSSSSDWHYHPQRQHCFPTIGTLGRERHILQRVDVPGLFAQKLFEINMHVYHKMETTHHAIFISCPSDTLISYIARPRDIIYYIQHINIAHSAALVMVYLYIVVHVIEAVLVQLSLLWGLTWTSRVAVWLSVDITIDL